MAGQRILRAEWERVLGTVGDTPRMQRAARHLPERPAWILRAMDALDDGDAATVERTILAAEAAGQCDIAAILRMCLAGTHCAPPDTIREETLQCRLDRHSNEPVGELLATLAARLRQKPLAAGPPPVPRPSPEFQRILDLLADHSTMDTPDCRSPRWFDAHPLVQHLEAVLRDEADLSTQRDDIEAHLQSLPRTTRLEWLGRLLRYLDVEIHNGEFTSLVDITYLAHRLAYELPRLRDLATQLGALLVRLQWVERPDRLTLHQTIALATIWSTLPTTAKYTVADTFFTDFVFEITDDTLSDATGTELLRWYWALEPDLKKAMVAVLSVPHRWMQAALETNLDETDMPVLRRRVFRSIHAIIVEKPTSAIRETLQLISEGHHDEAKHIATVWVNHAELLPALPDSLTQPLFDALATMPIDGAFAAMLAKMMHVAPGCPTPNALQTLRAVAAQPPPTADDWAKWVGLRVVLGDEEGASALYNEKQDVSDADSEPLVANMLRAVSVYHIFSPTPPDFLATLFAPLVQRLARLPTSETYAILEEAWTKTIPRALFTFWCIDFLDDDARQPELYLRLYAFEHAKRKDKSRQILLPPRKAEFQPTPAPKVRDADDMRGTLSQLRTPWA